MGLIKTILKKCGAKRLHDAAIKPLVNRLFFTQLIKQTENFSHLTWLGQPVWQNVLDLWTIQETLWEVQPELLIECGTNRGGSAYFCARLFDLMGKGRIVTIDVQKMHELSHPRIEFLIGSSVSDAIVGQVGRAVASTQGPILVMLDSDPSAPHVRQEMELYAPFVTARSFLHVQDGVIDKLEIFRHGRPGPLAAIEEFLRAHPEFEVDLARSERFLITHHPKGWLRRMAVHSTRQRAVE